MISQVGISVSASSMHLSSECVSIKIFSGLSFVSVSENFRNLEGANSGLEEKEYNKLRNW